MRIALLVTRFRPHFLGGGEKQAHLLAGELARRGHQVTVLTRRFDPSLPAEEKQGGLRILRFSDSPAVALAQVLAWLWRHRGEVDIVHAHQGNLPAFTAGLARWGTGVPAVVTLFGGGLSNDFADAMRGGLRYAAPLYRFALRRIDRFVAKSEEALREVEARGLPGVRIGNAAAPEDFAAGRRVASTARRGAVAVARLDAFKDFPTVFEAWRLLKQRGIREPLTVVGDGPDRERLQALARGMGLEGAVVWAGAQREVRPFLERARVLVHSSVGEGMPNAVLEAMTAGLPVAVSRVGALASMVKDGREGFVVSPGDARGLARRLEWIFRHAGAAEAMGRRAREKARKAFSLREIADRYERLYAGLAASHRK